MNTKCVCLEEAGTSDFLTAKARDGDLAFHRRGRDKPDNERGDLAGPGGDHGTGGIGVLPHHHVPEWDDGRSDYDAHEEVHPAEAEADPEQNARKEPHDNAEEADAFLAELKDVVAGRVWVDVLAVDVVGDERRDGDGLGGAGGHDGHEEHDGDHEGAGLAKEKGRDGGRDEALPGLVGGNGELEGGRSEAERSGEREGDGEPHDAAEKVALRYNKTKYDGSKLRIINTQEIEKETGRLSNPR